MRLAGTILALAFMAAPVAQAQPRSPAAAEAIIRTFPEFTGVVLVARDGKPIFQMAVGQANREWAAPNQLNTKFRIGSMTKAFTAAAIMQLHEAGKLDIDDPVGKVLKDAPASWGPVTIRHLLSHTSGMPNYLAAIPPTAGRQDMTPDELIALIRDKPLMFKPGSRRLYSNTGYLILGKVIETVSGQGYSDYVRDHLLKPAGMNSSGYDVPTEILSRRAAGYTVRDNRLVNAPFFPMTVPFSAGGLYSTAEDILKWDQALYSTSLLSAASRAEMFKEQSFEYGFGWTVINKFGHANVNHGGDVRGFQSQIERYPLDKLTVIVLSNLEGQRMDLLADDLAALYLGVPARKAFDGGEPLIRRFIAHLQRGEVPTNEVVPAVATALAAQMAYYQKSFAAGGDLKSVKFLHADAPGQDRYRLTFANRTVDWTSRFDSSGKIISWGTVDVAHASN